MWKKWFKKKIGSTPLKEESRGSVVSRDLQEKIAKARPKQEVATLLVDRNRWALIATLIAIGLIICLIGWYRANERAANNIKVAFVKLQPSGLTDIVLYDENSKPTYYMNTIYSLLSQYVERRFSKSRYSIDADYGFVLNYMSPQLKSEFLTDYKAATVAAEFAACKSCPQLVAKIRNIQHNESNEAILEGKPGTVFRTTLFTVMEEHNPEGGLTGKANQIITLIWRIKDISKIPTNLDFISANPIGIEILSESLKVDPTPAV
jgi:hypothetical protein